MNRTSLTNRRGSMLVEVLIAVGVGSVIAAVAISMIVRLFRVEKSISNTLQTSGSERRMTDEFRQDSHTATHAELMQDDDVTTGILFHATPSESVMWNFAEDRLTRTVQSDGEKLRSDQFRLPEGTIVSMNLDQTNTRPLATLTVRRPSGPASKGSSTVDQPYREYQIKAAIGRDNRFAPSTNDEEETP